MSSAVEMATPAPAIVAGTTAVEASNIELPRSTSALDPVAKLKENPRTSYLPLLSPLVELAPKTTTDSAARAPPSYVATSSQKRRRSSAEDDTASPQGSEASYFDIGKGGDEVGTATSDSAKKQKLATPDDASSAQQPEEDVAAATSQSPQSVRQRMPVVELPDSIANPLMKALESSLTAQAADQFRQHRAYSVPRNMRSAKEPAHVHVGPQRSSFASVSTTSPTSPQQRRDSMRAQQLSLLASQARLASTGTTNVNTAVRAEKALKGAVWKAVENVQARKERASIAGTLVSAEGEDQVAEPQRRASAKDSTVTSASTMSSDPVDTWSEALATPRKATMFMDSVEEVAHDWANGFYAYEKKWVGDALQRVQAGSGATSPVPLSPTDSGAPAPAEAVAETAADASEPPVGRRTSLSAPPPVTTSALESPGKLGSLLAGGVHHTTETMDLTTGASPNTNAARLTLMAAQRRISVALPAKRVSIAATADAGETARTVDLGVGGGKLLDVLSNFATLIDSRKEGCHSLEKLAHNARRLSAVQLPSMLSSGSHTTRPSYGVAADAVMAGFASAMSSQGSSPVSVASPRC